MQTDLGSRLVLPHLDDIASLSDVRELANELLVDKNITSGEISV